MLYAVNELVPSTLMVMPLYWFQEMVVREERASSVAQAQVSRLQKRQDELLHALLPPQIVKLMRSGEGVLIESTRHAAVLFVYVCNLKELSLTADADGVIKWLSTVYAAFDEVLQRDFKTDIVKIETQHDHFLAVSGIFEPDGMAADLCVDAACRMAQAIADVKQPDGLPTMIKLGVSAGPLSGGVVGMEFPRFSVFGQPVVSAARMASTASPTSQGAISVHLSKAASNLLTQNFVEQTIPKRGFALHKCGSGQDIKGLGFQQTWVVERDGPARVSRSLQQPITAGGGRGRGSGGVTFA